LCKPRVYQRTSIQLLQSSTWLPKNKNPTASPRTHLCNCHIEQRSSPGKARGRREDWPGVLFASLVGIENNDATCHDKAHHAHAAVAEDWYTSPENRNLQPAPYHFTAKTLRYQLC